MADRKISELTNLTGANLADDDEFPLVDTSADETKAITFGEFKTALDTATGFVRITGDTMTGNLSMGDNVKAIFGAGSDLQIYHNGTGNYVDAAGVGHLILQSQGDDKDVKIKSDDGSGGLTEYFRADGSIGKAQMFYYGTKKLETTSAGIDVTGQVDVNSAARIDSSGIVKAANGSEAAPTHSFLNDPDNGMFRPTTNTVGFSAAGTERMRVTSTGIDVTGTVTADGLTVDGNGSLLTLDNGSNPATLSNTNGNITLDFDTTNAGRSFNIEENGNTAFRINGGGDISLYEDTGTTPKFFWDASAESLGIGTSSPSASLHIEKASGNVGIQITSGNSSDTYINFGDSADTNAGLIAYEHDNNAFAFRTNGSERMRITSAGSVGVGTSSPSAPLTVETSATTNVDIKSTATNGTAQARFSNDARTYSLGIDNSDSFFVYDATGTSTRMTITSSGSVGIGRTSPNSPLDVQANSNSHAISIIANTSGDGYLRFRNNADSETYGNIGMNSSEAMRFTTNGSERMRITSSGSVGIGTSSPSTALHIEGANGDLLTVKAASGSEFTMHVDGNEISLKADADNDEASSVMTFDIDGSEAMRLDASGNLLVGRTSSSGGADGIRLFSDGFGGFHRDSAEVMQVDRGTTDGTLISLRKDGSAVGSIKVKSDRLAITDNTYGGIVFANGGNGVLPAVNDGTPTNNSIDLGNSAFGWKDLYLSGGVYLGGTGSANKLDDYEEGTWTPAFATSGINVGYSNQLGNYTKIGREVFVNFQINLNSVTSQGSGDVFISGLPFTFASGGNYGRYNIQTYNINVSGSAFQMFAYASGGTTLGILYSYDNATWSGASTSNFSLSSNSIIAGTFHYIAS